MHIGKHKLKNRLVVAPMAGVTDRPFRQLCKLMGAGMAVSEMVASNSLLWGSEKTRRRADHEGEVDPISVQIAGADPQMLADAARLNVDNGAQIIDINMGCPAKKVCNVMAGSALLKDEPLVARILEAVVSAVDFPELPDEMPTKVERKRWLALNQIICETCEPQLSKRRISTAGELADALRRLQDGKRRRRRRPIGAFIATLLTAGVLVLGGWEVFKGSPWGRFADLPPDPPVEGPALPVKALIKVSSQPEGADVFDANDELVGTTPTDLIQALVGEQVTFRIQKDGFTPTTLQAEVPASAAEEPLLLEAELKIYSPPQPNEPWTCSHWSWEWMRPRFAGSTWL